MCGVLLLALPAHAAGVDYVVKELAYAPGAVRHRLATSRLLFIIVDPYGHLDVLASSARKLWRSDGTCAGTAILYEGGVSDLTAMEDTVFFAVREVKATPDSAGAAFVGQLWKTDGSTPGTARVADLASPRLTRSGAYVYFQSPAGLWRTDGTPQGTGPATEIPPAVTPPSPFFFDGATLWKTDGTKAGTVPVKVIDDFEELSGVVVQDGIVYFVVNAYWAFLRVHSRPTAVWRSDLTPEGTFPILRPNDMNYSARIVAAVPGLGVVFQAGPASPRREGFGYVIWQTGPLWVADRAVTEARQLTTRSYDYLFDGPVLLNGVLLYSSEAPLGLNQRGNDLRGLTLATVCGDGIATPDEGCDDGNRDDDDCCSNACVLRAGDPQCGEGAACVTTLCGDGVLQPEEECDDGNSDDTGCCGNSCTPKAEGAPCRDGDVCTRDTCDGLGHCGVPLSCGGSGCADGTSALMAALSADMAEPACKRLPRRFAVSLKRAARYVRRAARVTPPKVRRWLGRADSALAHGERRVRGSSLAPACRTAATARYGEVRAILACLVDGSG